MTPRAQRSLWVGGPKVSEIGFGTWGLGGESYGPMDRATAIPLLRAARDRGVTFYDTSDLYGGGRAEELLGEAFLGTQGDSVVIATKGGLLPHRGFTMPEDFSTRHMRAALEDSLRRLRRERVDLYQLHSPSRETLRERGDALTGLFSDLRDKGMIGGLALSARSPSDALEALEVLALPFDAVQVNLNMIDQRAVENGLLSLCHRRGIGVIARTPLCFGYLTGRLTGQDHFPGQDHRANWPDDQLSRWAGAPGLFDALHGPASGRTAAQLALLYCLAQPGVATVIPGMMTQQQMEENLVAATLPPLTEAELDRITTIYRANTFYDTGAKTRERHV
ncbi:MAG: aldo/keto reductase [Rhodospirillum sp.]|nr:aldo/keto reductase [Rhodospirillum sp.]MCF8487633.1 aldo/keto reductase [Rhodospirillum sp.]MCF8499237.1 aldo/keto reductase [Rhodospirillum sp.]